MNGENTKVKPDSETGHESWQGLRSGKLLRIAWLPIPLLLMAIIAARMAGLNESYQSEILTLFLSFTFYTLVSLGTLFMIGRSFLASGTPALLLLECGVVLWSLAGTVGDAVSHGDANINVTIFNTAILLAGLCHLTGAILSSQPQRALRHKSLWLAVGVALALGTLWLVARAALSGWLPVFFIPGQGGTLVRYCVLASAIVTFVLSAGLLLTSQRQIRLPFTSWYTLALFLLGVGLFGVMIQLSLGCVVNWLGRTAQWLGGVYLFIAALASLRQSHLPLLPTEKKSHPAYYRDVVAVALVIAAAAIRLTFLSAMGTQAPYVIFFPAVMFAAIYGGWRAGLLAIALSAILANYFWVGSVGLFPIGQTADQLAFVVFVLSAVMIVWVSEAMRRARAQAFAAETEALLAAEREATAELLRKVEERYHNLFNTMDEGFCVIEMIFDGENKPVDYRFLEINAAFEKQTGMHDAKGKLIRNLALDNEEYWFEMYGKVALTGEPIHFGNEAKALNRWFDVYAYRVGEPEDRQVAIIFNDTTERKRMEENLRSAHDELESRVQERTFELSEAYETLQREVDEHRKTAEHLVRVQKLEALGTLAGGIAHDFNNVLAGIIGFTEMVLEDIAPGTSEHKRLELVLKGATRGRDLVRQILTFSRKSEQDKKPLAMNQVVEEGLKLLRPTLPTTIEIVSKGLTNDDQILADPVQMHQILMNLCTNAAHAMREKGGTLDIQVLKTSLSEGNPMPLPNMKAGEYIVLKVSDTGSGMKPEILNQVFNPFFTTKQPGEGTGLGLSVVHGIIKSHDGHIAVESEPEKGTTFHVYLPRIKEEERSIDKETPAVAGGKERILIVDDEDMLVELNEQRLGRLGYEVVATTSSMEALAIFRKEPGVFDLVITDHTMPNLTGMDLAVELLKVRATIPIILCTGQSDTVSPEKAREIGIRGFLMKPLANRELAEAVRRVLDAKVEG
jgi:signal transduction histidine kinase/ActR/RegA family two-component response regulator